MPNDDASCYNDTFWDLHQDYRNIILSVKGFTGALSLVAVTVSFILFFMFRRYKKDHLTEIGITERLILYCAVAAIIRSVIVILQVTEVNYDGADKTQLVLCKVMGFLDQWSIWGVLLTTQMILVHLFIQLTFRDGLSTKKQIIEAFYIAFPVLFPLLFSWVPFMLTRGYGISGAWCWICRTEYQVIFWFGPLIACQFINLIFLLIVYPVLFFKKINKEDRSDLIKQHAPLLLTILLAVVVNVVALTNRLISIDETVLDGSQSGIKLSVWITHAIASSCWGIDSAIVIMLYLLALYRQQPDTVHERSVPVNGDDDDDGLLRSFEQSYELSV